MSPQPIETGLGWCLLVAVQMTSIHDLALAGIWAKAPVVKKSSAKNTVCAGIIFVKERAV